VGLGVEGGGGGVGGGGGGVEGGGEGTSVFVFVGKCFG